MQFALTFLLSVGANAIRPYIFTVRRGECNSPSPAFALYYTVAQLVLIGCVNEFYGFFALGCGYLHKIQTRCQPVVFKVER